MLNRRFGWTTVEVPVIGQGTWEIHAEPQERAKQALRIGLDLGLTHIDTAESYPGAEELAGTVIAARRERVFLTTKVHPGNASFDGTLRACERSLNRLKTDWIDLYLLHWRSAYPIRETMRAMETLVARRQVRFIGVSNFGVRHLKMEKHALRNKRLACNPVRYHLMDRAIERQLVPYCAAQQIAVVAYSPFGHGDFPPDTGPARRLLAAIAERCGHTAAQVALNFLTRDPILFTIPKATTLDHVRENAGAAGWTLPADAIQALNRAFPVRSALSEWNRKIVRKVHELVQGAGR